MRSFLAPDLSTDQVSLDKESSHHLLRVTGIGPGESVQLVDGCGNRVIAILEVVERGIASLTIQQRLPFEPRRIHRVLAIGLLRASIFDQVIRQATEMGVDRIVPIQASRSVAKAGKPERWQRIARSSLLQCGRSHLPEISPVQSLSQALGLLEDIDHVSILTPMSPLLTSSHGSQAVLIGPEGGWSDDEQQLAVLAGVKPAGLGANILRADTAVVAALARI